MSLYMDLTKDSSDKVIEMIRDKRLANILLKGMQPYINNKKVKIIINDMAGDNPGGVERVPVEPLLALIKIFNNKVIYLIPIRH